MTATMTTTSALQPQPQSHVETHLQPPPPSSTIIPIHYHNNSKESSSSSSLPLAEWAMIELNGELLPPIELPTSDDNDDDNDAQRPSKKSKLELGIIKMEGKVRQQKNGYEINNFVRVVLIPRQICVRGCTHKS